VFDGGFFVGEAKTNIDWVDANTLLVGSDFGDGSLTTSGCARTLRLWRRGTALENAEQIIEVGVEDMSVGTFTVMGEDSDFSFIVRRPDFFTEETWLMTEQGIIAKLPLQIDANFQGVLGQRVLLLLRSDWIVFEGETYAAGSLVSLDLAGSITAQAPVGISTVLNPRTDDQLDAISGVGITGDSVYITALKDVAGMLLRVRPDEDGWEVTRIELPENGDIRMTSQPSSSGRTRNNIPATSFSAVM
jgi:prolyl oligopeptidase